ncbi:hypothetical protein QVD17_10126 [Tagetes erecta]|uniref:Uncharacterized protein n=1 Tax=Tagetes erecta TaxID=13708 RepID=A0AAD8P5X1_TARER|nr:hypothetical protein QVD17_10126 [Tagetes erecta]
MLASTPSFGRVTVLPLHKEHKAHARLDVRAQGLRDEGRSNNSVDSNMKLLKDRIEVMRAKERLERSHNKPCGWDQASQYVHKRPEKQPEYLQTLALVFGMSSLPIFIGTVLLCIISIIVHLKT